MGLFDLSDREEGGGFEPLAAGDYRAVIQKMEIKTSAAGNKGVNVQFQITEGSAKNRIQFAWLGVFGEERNNKISKGQLHTIGECVGVDMDKMKSEKDFNKVYKKPLIITVSFDDLQERFKNSITGYKSVGGKASNAADDDDDDGDVPF